MISIKSFIVSILAALGLASGPNIQQHSTHKNSQESQTPKSTIPASDNQKNQNSTEIIDINPVSNPSIVPSDLERTKMFSESFCGPLQALLFAGIREKNTMKIDQALSQGADINKPTNCWRPLDEAIEQVIGENHNHLIEYLLHRGAMVSPEQIIRLQYKHLAYETNITSDPKKMEITLGPVTTTAEKIAEIEIINTQLRKNQEQCSNIVKILQSQLKKQEQELAAFANRTSSLSAAAAASASINPNPSTAPKK